MVRSVVLGLMIGASAAWAQAPVEQVGGRIDLPTSKQITGVVPGGPQRLNSLPVSMAVSPDGRYVVTVNAGYGSFESRYAQSLAVLDTQKGAVVDYPEMRTLTEAKQTLFSGLAFSADGRHVYASMASTSDPGGVNAGDTGAGVAVYSFDQGKIASEGLLKIAPQKLAGARRTKLGKDPMTAVFYPAAIVDVPALQRGGEGLLVAGNLSDDVIELNAATGA